MTITSERVLELKPSQLPKDLLLKPTYEAFKNLRPHLSREERRKWALLNPALFNEWYIRPFDKKWKTDTPDFHFLMLEFVLSHDRVVIHVPVEHAKSTLFSIGFPLWLTYKDRNIRGAIISNTARQASGFMRRVMWHIANNPLLKEDFGTFEEGGVEPSFKEKWTEEQIIVKRDVWGQSKDPTWQAIGVEGAIYGARLDVAILDDVIDLSNSLTDHTRRRVEDWFHEMLESRIVDGGQIIVLGTLQHEKDLLCSLSENPEYAYLRLECYDEENHVTLWPEVWPEKRVLRRKRSIGSTRFRKQMQNDRRARTGNMLKTEWLNFYGPQHEVQLPPSEELIFYAGVDPAITDSREKAELEDLDFFVLTILGYHPATALVFGIEQVRFRGTLPQQIDVLEEKYKQYRFKLVGIEANAYQKALAQAARLSKLLIPVKTVTTSLGKIPRMEVLASHFETKRIWIPPTWNAFIDEWMDFPDGPHDDTLDSVDIAFKVLQEDVREMEDEELRRSRRVARAHVV